MAPHTTHSAVAGKVNSTTHPHNAFGTAVKSTPSTRTPHHKWVSRAGEVELLRAAATTGRERSDDCHYFWSEY